MSGRVTAVLLAALVSMISATGHAVAGTGGHVRVEHGVSTAGSGTALSRQELMLEAESREGGACAARFALRLRRDTQLGPRPHSEADLRDGFVACRAGEWQLAAGRQIVAWGKADGFPVLDAVHPFDLREFVLQDRAQTRRPLTMLRIERRVGADGFVQALLIPEARFHRLPAPGARFAAPWGGAAVLAEATGQGDRSEWSLRRPQWGLKWEHAGATLGWTANVLRRVTPDPAHAWDAVRGRPRALAEREWVLGLSFDAQVGASVLRGEAVHRPRTRLPIAAGSFANGRFHSSGWMLGLDRPWGDWLLGAQWFQQTHRGDVLPPLGGRREATFTLLATRSFHEDRLRLRAFLAQDMRHRGTWGSLAAAWQWHPALRVEVQADHFQGGPDSAFGLLEDEGRLSLALQADF